MIRGVPRTPPKVISEGAWVPGKVAKEGGKGCEGGKVGGREVGRVDRNAHGQVGQVGQVGHRETGRMVNEGRRRERRHYWKLMFVIKPSGSGERLLQKYCATWHVWGVWCGVTVGVATAVGLFFSRANGNEGREE